jgi:hypothetical protein
MSLKKLLLFLILTGYSLSSFAADRYKVNTERLNVRATIGALTKPFGYFQYGDIIEVTDKTNPSWYKTKIQGREGYVRSKYLSLINDTPTMSEKPAGNYILIFGVVFVVFSIIVCIIAVFTKGNKPAHNNYNSPPGTTIIVKHKSVGVAILLTLFFGPFGMFYSTIKGALTMIFLPIIILIILVSYKSTNDAMSGGMLIGSIIFYFPICLIWAAVAASSSNKKIIYQSPLSNYNEN